MFRLVGGVILGYLVMAIIVFVTLTGSYFAMGADRVFLPASYQVTSTWLVVMLLFSLVAAIAGGRVCGALSRKKSAVTALAVVVLLLGMLNAIPVIMASSGVPVVRTGDVPNLQAMMNGKEPAWFVLLLPLIGVVGVWIGRNWGPSPEI